MFTHQLADVALRGYIGVMNAVTMLMYGLTPLDGAPPVGTRCEGYDILVGIFQFIVGNIRGAMPLIVIGVLVVGITGIVVTHKHEKRRGMISFLLGSIICLVILGIIFVNPNLAVSFIGNGNTGCVK